MPKEYYIKTISDITEVLTPENIENFKKDFSSFLDITLSVKLVAQCFKDSVGIEKLNTFYWVDDGKNNATVNVKIKF